MEANATTGSDVPYNFLIGNDGQTYQGRGWSHQSGFVEIPQNSSLTIGFMGMCFIYLYISPIKYIPNYLIFH